jgi:uncharacterized membrane protein
MIECLKASGIFGLLVLIATVMLLAASIFVACSSKSRKGLTILAVLALLPLLLGLAGTAIGYSRTEQFARMTPHPDESVLQDGRKESLYATHIGFACSFFLLSCIAVMGLIKKPAEPADELNKAPKDSLS